MHLIYWRWIILDLTDSASIRPDSVRGKALAGLYSHDKVILIDDDSNSSSSSHDMKRHQHTIENDEVDGQVMQRKGSKRKGYRENQISSPSEKGYERKFAFIATPNDINRYRQGSHYEKVPMINSPNLANSSEESRSDRFDSKSDQSPDRHGSRDFDASNSKDVKRNCSKDPSISKNRCVYLNSRVKQASQLLGLRASVPVAAITLDLT